MSVVTISTYKEADEALRLGDLRQALYDEGAVLMKDVLVNLHGEEHRARRNLEQRIFRRDFFRYYESDVFPRTLRETLAPFVAQGRADLVDFGYRVMLNLTADFSGIDRPARSAEETETILRLMRIFGKAATLGQAKGDREAIRAEIRAAMADFDARFCEPSVRSRRAILEKYKRGEIAESELPRDILTVLLQNEDNIDLSREALLREMGFFLLAGAFTSIHTMTHAMHEIFAWCAAHLDDRERIDADPIFLQRCIWESMRLHPSSPVAKRRPTCPIHLPTGADAMESDDVVVDLMTANRDTSVFGADAASYNPHRQTLRGASLYGLSFGTGIHACIGRTLAAGVPLRANMPAKDVQYGTVHLIVRTLLDHDARPDPADPGVLDTSTTRTFWARYPVLLAAG
jgi:cytochrome P450